MQFKMCDRADLLDAWPHVRDMVRSAAKSSDYTIDDLRDALARGDARLVTMTDNGSIVGFAALYDLIYPRRRYIKEAHLWLDPKLRGNGTYRSYVEFIRKWATDNGYDGTVVTIPSTDEVRWRPLLTNNGYSATTVDYVWEAN